MTGKQYEAILSALADKLLDKETTITVQHYQIEELQKRLDEAEWLLDPAGKEKPATLEIR